ncbi:glycosyltransferase [Hymenobacter pini]|uniref:glycosyltransferase n=1 Tax=Hymenobacter pini TaxID=2880879 RepID=UPI001CF5DB0A|nr:glycosyltransferase [Hymenobacter pini]MCA8829186.1 glycosyltransferase [Hymenobacter pini]
MPFAPLPVLLLGWNSTPRSGEPVPALAPVVDSLAAATALEVVVPHLPADPLPQGQHTHIISLAALTPEEIRAAVSNVPPRPAAWRHPAAPYTGATPPAASLTDAREGAANGAGGSWQVPAAPYQGATPALASAAPTLALPTGFPEERPALVDQQITTEALQPSSALASPALANTAAPLTEPILPNVALPSSAVDLLPVAIAEVELAPELSPNTTALLASAHATLPEALAVLNLDLAPDADLNFQVIQYARFATRQALQDSFSVIYAPDWPTWLAAMEIRQQTGRPLVLHVHSLAEERATPADRGWALELERLALRRADLVLAASAELAHRLRVRYNLTPERLQLVHASDTDALQGVLQQFENRLPGRPAVVPFFPPTP